MFDKSKNGVDRDIVEVNRVRFQAAKASVKCVVSRAQEAEMFCEKLDREDKKGNVFRVVRQMVRQNKRWK